MKARLWRIVGAGAVPLCLFALSACVRVPPAPAPRAELLGDCSFAVLHFTRTLDPGSHFQMVIGVPRSAQLPPSFQGVVDVLLTGSRIAEYPIGSDDMQPCNWLKDEPQLQGYILTMRHTPSGIPTWSLAAGTTCSFIVKFDQMPPEGSSLWLTWVE